MASSDPKFDTSWASQETQLFNTKYKLITLFTAKQHYKLGLEILDAYFERTIDDKDIHLWSQIIPVYFFIEISFLKTTLLNIRQQIHLIEKNIV